MARYRLDPISDERYGEMGGWGAGWDNNAPVTNALGRRGTGTGYWFHEGGGAMCNFGNYTAEDFGNEDILAVRIAHREEQGRGLSFLDNGWVMSDLILGDRVIGGARVYWQDGQRRWRVKEGPSIYNGSESWSLAQINDMRMQVGAARGPDWGPNRSNLWCRASEAWIEVITPDPLQRPNLADLSTDTVNPRFTVDVTGVQPEQWVQAVFQVAPDNGFDRGVREYATPILREDSATPTLSYKGDPGGTSHANLAPGEWSYRVKIIDMLGNESEWSAPARLIITLSTELPVPTLIEPREGATYQDPLAERSARFDLDGAWAPGERLLGVEWQFSQDSTFSGEAGGGEPGDTIRWTNYQGTFGGRTIATVRYNPSPRPGNAPLLHGPEVSVQDDDQRFTPQGVWYGQVRGVDSFGNKSDWSDPPTEFTVRHAPVARNLTPQGDDFDPRVSSFRWTFTDPWPRDRQTAYRLYVHEMPESGTEPIRELYGSGKVISSAEGATVEPEDLGLDDTPRNLRVMVALWDTDNQGSTQYQMSTFRYRRAPIVTVTSPTGSIASGQPTITWESVFSEGTHQVKFRVIITNTTTGEIEHDSRVVDSAATSYEVQSSMLSNMSHFEVRVYVFDSGGPSSSSGLTGWNLELFSTNFVIPQALSTSVESSNYERSGYIDVWWTGETDTFFQEYRIYRREYRDGLLPNEGWLLSGTVTDAGRSHYRDYNPSGAAEFEFSVVQVANRYGAAVESPKRSTAAARTMVFSSDYWFIVPGDEELSVKLHSVVGDSFTEQYESSTYHIVGGGARVNRGDRIGMEGSLSCQIRSSTVRGAKEQVEMLRTLAGRQQYLVMRDPFGNATKVALGDIEVDRLGGVGNHEFADIEVPYTEVM